MIALLKKSDLQGLKPEDYNADLWDEQIAHLIDTDICFTVSLMRYLAEPALRQSQSRVLSPRRQVQRL